MNNKTRLLWISELVWWVFSLVVALIITHPIYIALNDFIFYWDNVFLIMLFINYTRYIFLLKNTLFAYSIPVKTVLVFLSVPLLMYLVSDVHGFQSYLDNDGRDKLLLIMKGEATMERVTNLIAYLRPEFMFFGAGAIIVAVILPIRMVFSIWKTYNRGTI